MTTWARKRTDSDAESIGSVASEPVITRSRSTTPFTLRSQCTRHGSECPEGHGISYRNRLKLSPRSSSKKSSRKITTANDGSLKKNLGLSLETQHQSDHPDYSVTPKISTREKPKNYTSDYSSAEEEEARKKTDFCTTPSIFTSTPLTTSLKTTPLKRSAEKTGFTYAKSYSYRTQVTPERIICMPNMTRRSIGKCHGDGFSSPELKFGITGKSTALNTSSMKGIDSDHELHDEEPYLLKTPPRSYSSAAYFFSSFAYSKLRGTMFSLAWWIYLITCYSLLLDTFVLQSRGISKLRNFCRQQIKINRNLLILFLFLPFCFFAGGMLYSALHAFNFHTEDNLPNAIVNPLPTQELFPPSSSYSNLMLDSSSLLNPSSDSSSPSNHLLSLNPIADIPLQSVSPVVALPSSTLNPITTSHRQYYRFWPDIKNELRLTKDALLILKQQVNMYDEKMSDVLSQVRLMQQGQMISVSTTETKDGLDRAVSSEITEDKFTVTMSQLEEVRQEMKELQAWKRTAERRHGMWDGVLAELQQRLDEQGSLSLQMKSTVDEALKQWEARLKPALIKNVKEELLAEVRRQIKLLNAASGQGISKGEVEQLIHSALGVYDSDKTGLADFALEPAGGVVLSTRCTETYNSHRPRLSIWGFSLWSEPNNPRVVIQPGIVPGQCWSFRGFDGYLVIQLSRKIIPTAFTLEHIPRRLAPDGQIDSAPRNFTVYGLTREVDIAGVELGQYTYDNLGPPLQSFPVQVHDSGAFSIVELRIHSNYGNLNYTCLYRFRVHGQVA